MRLASPFACLLVAVPLALTARPAVARADDGASGLFRKDRLELLVGEHIGGFGVGPLGGVGFGGTLQARHGFGPVHIVLEAMFMDLGLSKGDEGTYDGSMVRIGAAAQLHFARFGDKSVGFDLYAETGTGQQEVYWDGGGKLTRQDLALGLGLRALFKVGGSHEQPQVITVDVGVRGYVARAPDLGQGPTCAALCDERTEPFPYDVAVFSALAIGYGW